MRLGIAIAAVLLGSSWIAAPALAQYGAIAWDKETGKYGASWKQLTQKLANEKALAECGTSGCKVVTRIDPIRCGALATTADGKQVGAAARKTRDEARLAALKNCPTEAGECTVRVADCNK
jgi:hypothetical protein